MVVSHGSVVGFLSDIQRRMADMEDFLFGSDLEDSDDEAKSAKTNKESERESQLNELFGDSPSEGEEEQDHATSDKDEEEEVEEEDSGGEIERQKEEGRKNSDVEDEDEEDKIVEVRK